MKIYYGNVEKQIIINSIIINNNIWEIDCKNKPHQLTPDQLDLFTILTSQIFDYDCDYNCDYDFEDNDSDSEYNTENGDNDDNDELKELEDEPEYDYINDYKNKIDDEDDYITV